MAHPNPFLDGRTKSNDRYTDLAKARRNWQVATFVFALFLGVSEGRNFWILSKQQVQPFWVEHDGKRIVATYPTGATTTPTNEVILIQSELEKWIQQAREMPMDWESRQKEVWNLWQKVSGPAEVKLASYYREHSPQELWKQYTVGVEDVSVLPDPDIANRWIIRWKEIKQAKDIKQSIEEKKWWAHVTIERRPLATLPQALKNPLGLVVTAFSWGEEMDQ